MWCGWTTSRSRSRPTASAATKEVAFAGLCRERERSAYQATARPAMQFSRWSDNTQTLISLHTTPTSAHFGHTADKIGTCYPELLGKGGGGGGYVAPQWGGYQQQQGGYAQQQQGGYNQQHHGQQQPHAGGGQPAWGGAGQHRPPQQQQHYQQPHNQQQQQQQQNQVCDVARIGGSSLAWISALCAWLATAACRPTNASHRTSFDGSLFYTCRQTPTTLHPRAASTSWPPSWACSAAAIRTRTDRTAEQAPRCPLLPLAAQKAG